MSEAKAKLALVSAFGPFLTFTGINVHNSRLEDQGSTANALANTPRLVWPGKTSASELSMHNAKLLINKQVMRFVGYY